jgi:segregation and condensation protein B
MGSSVPGADGGRPGESIMPPAEETLLIDIPQGAWELEVEPTVLLEETVPEDVHPSVAAKNKSVETPASPPPLERIIEAILFAATEPLPSQRINSIIRGLTEAELAETIQKLNQQYRRQARPYAIERSETGYRLTLRTGYHHFLEALHGGLKEIRFTQFVIETMAVVAYRQPITQVEVETILGQECGSALRQLIRRGLLQLQAKDSEGKPLYITTSRFLEFFQLTKVEDLPRADDLERL